MNTISGAPDTQPGQGRKTLIIHAGFAKTGTSALQVAFARNRSRLADHGILYAPIGAISAAESGAITSGNAAEVATHLCGEISRPTSIAHLFEALSGQPHHTALVSSEIFQAALPDRLGVMLNQARAHGYDVKAVFFVRSFYDWLWSAYVQNVKNHGVTATFPQWAHASSIVGYVAKAIETYDALLGADNVILINYDTCRSRLFPTFVKEILHLNPAAFEFTDIEQVNRTLSPREIELLRTFNRIRTGRNAGKYLSDALITARPDHPSCAPIVDAAVLDLINARMGPVLPLINARIVGGPTQVASASNDAPQGSATNAEDDDIDRILLLLVYSISLDSTGAFAALKQKIDAFIK